MVPVVVPPVVVLPVVVVVPVVEVDELLEDWMPGVVMPGRGAKTAEVFRPVAPMPPVERVRM